MTAKRTTERTTEKTAKKTNVSHQIMWNRLISIVEEQAQALIRTAFSTSVREAGDLSAGVYNKDGAMLAQAVTGTPGHVNAMADAVAHFIAHIGAANIHEGDVYITNDPWMGTGHLHDITVVTPCFYKNNFVGFFACTAHIVDIGGRGFGADANSIYEEGLYIPIMKLADRGKMDATLMRIIRANVREPDQLIGDVHALITCNQIGIDRLCAMMGEYAISGITALSDFILTHSRAATIAAIAALPRKVASGAMQIDGYDTPITLKVRLAIKSDRIECDFAGTSPIDRKGINVPLVYTKAYACYALKCAIAPDIPNNAASLMPFIITAPRGSIVNAEHPAPVALRHVIGHFIPDTVYEALDQILPRQLPAQGAGTLCNFQLSLRGAVGSDLPRAEILTFNSGGSGARPTLDGMNTTAFPSGVMTMPVEATEQAAPIIIWRKELRADSGGAGQFRGGLGQWMTVGAEAGYAFDFQAMFDRLDHAAAGRAGGGAGAKTVITRSDGVVMRGKGKQFVPQGCSVQMGFAGGGGYGTPSLRDAEALRRDVLGGYVSAERAKTEYGSND